MKVNIHNLITEMNFPYLRISLTNQCNINCVFCHNEGQNKNVVQDKVKTFSIIEWKNIANYFKQYFNKVVFTGGEPLLVKNLNSIIKIFIDNGFRTSLTTNGILLDKQKQEELANIGLNKVSISIHALEANEYSKITQSSAINLEKLKNNLKTVSNFLPATCNVVINSDNFQKIEKLINFCSSYSIDLSIFLSHLNNKNTNLSNEFENWLNNKFIKTTTEKLSNRNINNYTFNKINIEYSKLNNKYNNCICKNNICNNCTKKEICVEGVYALRLLSNGDLKPCLIRNDNIIKYDTLKTEILKYNLITKEKGN